MSEELTTALFDKLEDQPFPHEAMLDATLLGLLVDTPPKDVLSVLQDRRDLFRSEIDENGVEKWALQSSKTENELTNDIVEHFRSRSNPYLPIDSEYSISLKVGASQEEVLNILEQRSDLFQYRDGTHSDLKSWALRPEEDKKSVRLSTKERDELLLTLPQKPLSELTDDIVKFLKHQWNPYKPTHNARHISVLLFEPEESVETILLQRSDLFQHGIDEKTGDRIWALKSTKTEKGLTADIKKALQDYAALDVKLMGVMIKASEGDIQNILHKRPDLFQVKKTGPDGFKWWKLVSTTKQKPEPEPFWDTRSTRISVDGLTNTEKIHMFKELLLDGHPDFLKPLKGIDDYGKQNILQVCHPSVDHNTEQYTVCALASRYLNPTKEAKRFLNRKYKSLQGPVSVYHLTSDEYPQEFYLFGDTHITTAQCPPVKPKNTSAWFYMWMALNFIYLPVSVDFYMETVYKRSGYTHTDPNLFKDNYLSQVYKEFEDCWGVDKTECRYGGIHRFHYTDTRMITSSNDHQPGIHILRNLISRDLTLADMSGSIFNALQYYYQFLRNDPRSHIIQKQIDAIGNEDISSLLRDKFQTAVESLSEEIQGINVLEAVNISQSDVEFMMRIKVVEVFEHEKDMMDIYLMARCFRNFHQKGQEYSWPSYNNVIYAGDEHIKTYVKFLTKELGYKTQYKRTVGKSFYPGSTTSTKGEKYYQCVDISGMKQPIFKDRFA